MALVSRAVALCALVLLASATPAAAAQWLRVTDIDSIIADVDVARTGNGALNVLWGRDASVLNSQVSANLNMVTGPHTVFVYENTATQAPALLAAPGGGLRAFFYGIDGGEGPHDTMVSTATSADGIAWAVQPTAASDSTPEGSVSKGMLGGTIWANGTPMSIWGDQYRGYHVGTDDQTPDVTNFGSDKTATVTGPNAATDSATGAVAIAWNDLDTGRTEVAFVQPTTDPWFPPGPSMAAPGSRQFGPERIEMTGRSNGAAGIFIAYLSGTNVFSSRPTVWRIGDFDPRVLTKRKGAFYPGVAMSVDGRLWAFWHEGHTTGQNRRIFARRSNEKATKFGETVVVKPPQGTNDGNVWSLEGEGTAPGGALDLVALISKDAQNDDVGNYVTRVLPGITLKVKKLDNGNIQFKTFDAGDKLAKKIKFAGDTKPTGDDGKVTFQQPGPGKYTAKATSSGYTPTSKRVKVKAIEDPNI